MANAASLQAELAAGAGSDAYKTVAAIFDEGTFVETGALVTRRFSEVPGQGDAELAGAQITLVRGNYEVAGLFFDIHVSRIERTDYITDILHGFSILRRCQRT